MLDGVEQQFARALEQQEPRLLRGRLGLGVRPQVDDELVLLLHAVDQPVQPADQAHLLEHRRAQLDRQRTGRFEGFLEDSVQAARGGMDPIRVVNRRHPSHLHPRRDQELLNVVVKDRRQALALALLGPRQVRRQRAQLVGQMLDIGCALGHALFERQIQVAQLFLGLLALDRVADGAGHGLGVGAPFDEVILRSLADRLGARRLIVGAGHDDDGQSGEFGLNAREGGHARAVRQPEVQQHRVELLFAQFRHRRVKPFGHRHFISRAVTLSQAVLDQMGVRGAVFDEQYFGRQGVHFSGLLQRLAGSETTVSQKVSMENDPQKVFEVDRLGDIAVGVKLVGTKDVLFRLGGRQDDHGNHFQLRVFLQFRETSRPSLRGRFRSSRIRSGRSAWA